MLPKSQGLSHISQPPVQRLGTCTSSGRWTLSDRVAALPILADANLADRVWVCRLSPWPPFSRGHEYFVLVISGYSGFGTAVGILLV